MTKRSQSKGNGSKGKYYGKKTQYKGKNVTGPSERETEVGNNDPAWYAANAELLRDAASIPFSWALGTPIDTEDPLNAGNTMRKVCIPGIQTMRLYPSVGRSTQASDPINTAANATYAFVRHANSGHSNYNAPDLMLYLMAMTQVYSYIVFLQRTYGLATTYAQRNRYIPDSLLVASGADPVSVRSNLADFRYGINVLITKAASFAVPNNMSIFNRHAFLYGNVYTEGESIKDQLYMYVPGGFWKFKWNDATQAGELELSQFAANDAKLTVNELLNYGNTLLDILIQDEDMNIMSGDILKAYTASGILKLTPMQTDYPVVPVANLQVLEQMKNATVFSASGFAGTGVVHSSNKGFLVHTPQALVTVSKQSTALPWFSDAERKNLQSYLSGRIITTNAAEATPDIVMENTRLVVGCDTYSNDNTTAKINLWPGSEYVSEAAVYRFICTTNASTGVDELTTQKVVTAFSLALFSTTDEYAAKLPAVTMSVKSSFKFSPAIKYNPFKQIGSTNSAELVNSAPIIDYDVDNYAYLNLTDVTRLHEAALLNQLAVPSIAKIRG